MLGWVPCPANLGAALWQIPPIDGVFSGDLNSLTAPGRPSLHWEFKAVTTVDQLRIVEFTLSGPADRFSVEARLDAKGQGTWRVPDSELELGPWFAALTSPWAGFLSGITLSGRLAFSGKGRRDGENLTGRVSFSLKQGRFNDSTHKLTLEGVDLVLVIEDLAANRTAPLQMLSWTGGSYDPVTFGPGRVVFAVDGEQVRVSEASVALLGGTLDLGEFVFALNHPEVTVDARVVGIEVAQLLPLLPPVLAEARGRVDGAVRIKRDASGLQIGAGYLSLQKGQLAQLRLAPTPGLLSGSLPATVLKYYPGLGKIETGEVPLRAEVLEVTFTPEGDAEGRTASVRLAGGPIDPKLRAPIDLKVNVRGPLDSLVKFGTSSRLHFGGGTK